MSKFYIIVAIIAVTMPLTVLAVNMSRPKEIEVKVSVCDSDGLTSVQKDLCVAQEVCGMSDGKLVSLTYPLGGSMPSIQCNYILSQ